MVYLHLWQYWVVLLGFIFTALGGMFILYVIWCEDRHCHGRGNTNAEAGGIVFVVVFVVDRVATRVLGTADTCREFVYLVLVFGILMILCGLYLSL